MAQAVASNFEMVSNDNSTKEFLLHEKTCEAFKDSDEEIKMIFNEIKKLSDSKNLDNEVDEDSDDIELILKRAENIAQETENLLKSSPVAAAVNGPRPHLETGIIPHIKVTKPTENISEEKKTPSKVSLLYSIIRTWPKAALSLSSG